MSAAGAASVAAPFDLESLERVGNKYADQFLCAAERLGLRTEVIDSDSGLSVITDGQLRLSVRAAIIGCNNLVAARFSSNKFLTSVRLRRAGFRVPEFLFLNTSDVLTPARLLEAASEFAETRYPVVMKPVDSTGGYRVFAGIHNREELEQVVGEIWRGPGDQILIERHIAGNHYRIKLFDGEVIDLVARYPGFVEGDGSSTIQGLIDEKNQRKQANGNATIQVTSRTNRLLARVGRNLDSVLEPGERQQLVVESNLYLGGDTRRIPVGLIGDDLMDYLSRVSELVGLRWLGLDVIVDDIAAENAHETAVINETSSAHVPNDYHPGETLEQYLAPATMILERFFGLERTITTL